ncbi:MAG: ABC transporter ATP-binding protein [Clostridia bacterium]
MLEVNNLKKKFTRQDKNKKKTSFYAVNGVSFKADKGEIIGILGPNGAGKTTMLRMLAGIMEQSEGTIEIDGQNYKRNSLDIKRKIAFLSGNTKLYNRLSAHELLQMCGKLYGMNIDDINKREKEILKLLNLEEIKNAKIGNLSTGQTQRVGLARCLVHNPQYYILDEATTGLDIISSQIILDFIKEEKKRGKTILYSTHYMEEAENICDKVIMINKGQVIETGTPEEIKAKTDTTNLRDAFFALIGGVSNEE